MKFPRHFAICLIACGLVNANGGYAGELPVFEGWVVFPALPEHLPVASGQIVFGDANSGSNNAGVGQTVSEAATDEVAEALRIASQFCAALPQSEFVIDCYAAQLEEISKSLPKNGDYAEAQAIIAQAASRLKAVVRENSSKTLPRIRAKPGGGSTKPASRPLTAVATERLPEASAKAVAIMQETRTLLLRSTSNSDRRRSHYERIAQSMETGTILLRSL